MGDQRRTDKAKDHLPQPAPPKRARAGDDEEIALANRPVQAAGEGNAFDASPEHRFAGIGDQDALQAEIDAVLAAGVPVAGLAEKVTRLGWFGRAQLQSKLDDVAKVAPAGEVLQIADLVEATPSAKLRAALAARPAATAAQLRGHLAVLSAEALVAALDGPALTALQAKYPQPGAIAPQIGELAGPVLASGPLMKWYLAATPPATVAFAIMRVDESAYPALGKTLNELGRAGWLWAFHVDAAMAQLGETRCATLAPLSNQADVAQFLTAKAPKDNRMAKEGAPAGGSKALDALVPATGIDVDALIDALREASTFTGSETYHLSQSPYRERITAAASFEQLVVITETMSVLPEDQLGWYLESPHATTDRIRTATAQMGDVGVDFMVSPKNLKRLAARFPAASPGDLFGAQLGTLHARAAKDGALRRWVTAHAEPRELLAFVTRKPDLTQALWKALAADGIEPEWVHRLGTGANDQQLRVLALNSDERTAAWIRERLLGDYLVADHDTSTGAAMTPTATDTGGERVRDAVTTGATTAELGRRTHELTETEAAAVRADPTRIAEVLAGLDGKWLVDALFKVQPTVTDVLRYAQLETPGLATYLRTRGDAETTAALANEHAAGRAALRIAAPFAMLPALRKPAVLASVVGQFDAVGWILRTTDATHAIVELGRPAVAKATAGALKPEHIRLLPADLKLAPEPHAALERIASAIEDDALADRLRGRYTEPTTEEEDEESDDVAAPPPIAKGTPPTDAQIQARHDQLDAALQHDNLVGALNSLFTGAADLQNLLAVCRERASGALAMITKPAFNYLIDKLRDALAMSPIAVFPDVPYHAYLHTAPARKWLFAQEAPMALLGALAGDEQLIGLVGTNLDKADYGIVKWLGALPSGASWSAAEHRAMRTLFDHVKHDIAARMVFAARFGSQPDESYRRVELVRLWEMLERLPPAHVEQLSVSGYYEFAPRGGVAGIYSPNGKSISLEEGLSTSDRKHDEYDVAVALTQDELQTAYGWTAEEFKAHKDAGEIEPAKDDPAKWQVHTQSVVTYENTVLHEVGHAVDDMLGSNTELVFGIAGWKQYTEADFDRWATDLGGWNTVAPPDQAKIRDAWLVWLNSTQGDMMKGLDTFVGASHPAISDQYKGVGIVELAKQKKAVDAFETRPQGGHYSVVSHKYAHFYRVPERTANSAPSRYSMTAPAEYFAECYAEYYREWKGPTAPDSKKGGRLPSWIKGWFDHNVDRMAHNPSRK